MQWILNSWKALDNKVIASSFQSCGLCLPIDGSEDHKIHCFKNRQPCSAGAERLKAMSTIMDDQREDPFQNVTDSDIEEATPDVVILEEDSENDDLLEIE